MLTGSKMARNPSSVWPRLRNFGVNKKLLAQAHSLRARFGPPEQRLAEFLADMPPEDDSFWVEVLR